MTLLGPEPMSGLSPEKRAKADVLPSRVLQGISLSSRSPSGHMAYRPGEIRRMLIGRELFDKSA
jgi:hypothetical protein